MAIDFSKFTKAQGGLAKRAPALSPGDYPAVIKSHEYKEAPPDKDYQIIIRFAVGLTGWPEGFSESEKQWTDEEGKVHQYDLSKMQFRRDFYWSETDQKYLVFLDEFIRSCGIEPKGRQYEEILPDLHGAAIIAPVQQYMNQRTNEIGNQIGNIVGARG